jgi:predicted ATPase/class 3 adenylate cyclase
VQAVAALPTGTVTLLFTDIEGSTRLLQVLGDRYAEAVMQHRQVLRDVFARHGGIEVDTQGDAFFVAFSRAQDAVAAAADIQRGLAACRWPGAVGLRVRIGVHTGEPTVTDEGYVGMDVHRGARIAAAGHGGQVLLSQATRDLLPEELPGNVGVRDLGEHRLKDLTRAQRLFQLIIPELDSDFPPLKTLESRPTNLPTQATPLIGRERELQEVAALVERGDVRLLTLTGAGGTGKTRLALQVAADLVEAFPDGVFFVSLAPIIAADLVVPTIAQTLAVREQPGQSLEGTLKEYLRDRELLLLLDNFEQLLEAVSAVAELLALCARLKVVVTSRSPLRLSGERIYAVPPLALPDRENVRDAQSLSQYDAVALFLERATAVKHDFKMSDEDAAPVAEICIRLDGLPLALELAAARVAILPPHALLKRLGQRLALLTGGPRDLPARQQTLRSTIDWSYGLLSDDDQRLFARLAVFVGGCLLEAAEAVCQVDGDRSIDVLDGLSSLVEKNLVRDEPGAGGEPRFSMLETIREYALERLETSDEARELRRRHADYYLALAEISEPEILGPDQGAWLEKLDAERDNFRAALAFLLESRETELALRLIGALRRAWAARGYLTETRSVLDEALRDSDEAAHRVRAKALYGLGRVALVQGDYDASVPPLEQSAALFRELDDRDGLAYSLADRGWIAAERGDYVEARRLAEESLAVARSAGNRTTTAAALHVLACTALDERDYGRARSFFQESLALRRELGDVRNTANSLCFLGGVELLEGNYERAIAVLEEGLDLARKLKNRLVEGASLANLALVAALTGDEERTASLAADSLRVSCEVGDKRTTVECLHALAGVAAARGEPLRAAMLSGAAEVLHAAIKAPPSPAEDALSERFIPAARAATDERSFAAAWRQGRTMTLDEAIDYALSDIPETSSRPETRLARPDL